MYLSVNFCIKIFINLSYILKNQVRNLIYNISYISQIDEVKDKIKKNNIKKYGVSSHFQLKDNIRKSIESRRMNWFSTIKNNYDYDFIDINYSRKIINIKCDKGHE